MQAVVVSAQVELGNPVVTVYFYSDTQVLSPLPQPLPEPVTQKIYRPAPGTTLTGLRQQVLADLAALVQANTTVGTIQALVGQTAKVAG